MMISKKIMADYKIEMIETLSATSMKEGDMENIVTTTYLAHVWSESISDRSLASPKQGFWRWILELYDTVII